MKAYDGHEPYIFISYSHMDSEKAQTVIDGLMQNGFRVWYDNGIEAGSEWPEYIAERLMSCSVVIALMSKHAQDSHNCRREIHFAIELKKELLVVHLEDFALSPGMRLQLSSLQALFRSKSADDSEFIARLCDAAVLRSCKIPAETPAPAAEPEAAPEPEPIPELKPAAEPEPAPIPQEESKEELPEEPKRKTEDKPALTKREMLVQAVEAANEILKKKNYSWRYQPVREFKEKRLKSAIQHFGLEGKESTIIMIMDDTVRGNGKSGYAVTEDELICKGWLSSYRFTWDKIKAASILRNDIMLTFKDGTSGTFFFVKAERDAALKMINTYLSLRDGKTE